LGSHSSQPPGGPHATGPRASDTDAPSPQRLVWLDMEMTGLDPATCRIIEVATIITDDQLRVIAEGPNLVIHQPDAVLDAMDAWNTRQHGASGLTAAVRRSTLTEAEAEAQTLAFVAQHTAPGEAPLCGNSIHQDRRFIRRYMPHLDAHLHYRMIDVSTVKELARRWYDLSPPPKADGHRALDDIRESIAELAFYRAHIFRQP